LLSLSHTHFNRGGWWSYLDLGFWMRVIGCFIMLYAAAAFSLCFLCLYSNHITGHHPSPGFRYQSKSMTKMLLSSTTNESVKRTKRDVAYRSNFDQQNRTNADAMISHRSTSECLSKGLDLGLDDDNEFLMDNESNRRILATRRRYISYGALSKNNVPCSRRGASLTRTHAAVVPSRDAVIERLPLLRFNKQCDILNEMPDIVSSGKALFVIAVVNMKLTKCFLSMNKHTRIEHFLGDPGMTTIARGKSSEAGYKDGPSENA
ncbi:hypothetical protein M8C21_016990, partial [Ambrosia artemisiifolia]